MGRSSELDGLTTLPELLMQSIQKNGDREALRQYDRATGKWESWTYKELGEHVLAWRRAFAAMGLKPGERIAILMPNGRDHVCADQAALANGLIPVPLHAIDTPGASAFITIDSQAATLVTNKLTRWQQIRATGVPLPDLKNIIITDPGETEDKSEGRFHIRSLESILLEGASWTEDLPAGPLEDDLAGIIYTSGTTGRPKGVMLTHRNIVSNVKATLECVSPKVGDTFLSFLPLSHTFERTAGYYLALATGCIIAYNRSVLLLAEDLKTIKPTVIISVPRVYERIYARVQDKLRKSRPIAKKLFDWLARFLPQEPSSSRKIRSFVARRDCSRNAASQNGQYTSFAVWRTPSYCHFGRRSAQSQSCPHLLRLGTAYHSRLRHDRSQSYHCWQLC